MQIQVIGENSSNRTKLLKNINRVIKDSNIEIEIIEDKIILEKYHSISKPILLINDKLISNGKVLSDREISNYLKVLSD